MIEFLPKCRIPYNSRQNILQWLETIEFLPNRSIPSRVRNDRIPSTHGTYNSTLCTPGRNSIVSNPALGRTSDRLEGHPTNCTESRHSDYMRLIGRTHDSLSDVLPICRKDFDCFWLGLEQGYHTPDGLVDI